MSADAAARVKLGGLHEVGFIARARLQFRVLDSSLGVRAVDFRFTEEQLMIQDVARRIAQEKIAPSAEHHDRTGEFPLENIRLLGENGLMGIEVPAEYGGAGMDPIAYVLAMVEIAAADAAHSTIMSVNNSLFCNGILNHGTEAQKQKYVRAIAEGEEIGAFALTEPQSGSDATAMRCRAVKQADGSFVINGKKSWITSGPVAKYIVLFAMTDPDKGARGITAFMIDTDQRRLPPRQDRAQARHPRLGHLRDRVQGLRRAAPTKCSARKARASRSPWACSTPAASASPRRRSASPAPRTRRRWTT